MSRRRIPRERAPPFKRPKQTNPPSTSATTSFPWSGLFSSLVSVLVMYLKRCYYINWPAAIFLTIFLEWTLRSAAKLIFLLLVLSVWFFTAAISCAWLWVSEFLDKFSDFIFMTFFVVLSYYNVRCITSWHDLNGALESQNVDEFNKHFDHIFRCEPSTHAYVGTASTKLSKFRNKNESSDSKSTNTSACSAELNIPTSASHRVTKAATSHTSPLSIWPQSSTSEASHADAASAHQQPPFDLLLTARLAENTNVNNANLVISSAASTAPRSSISSAGGEDNISTIPQPPMSTLSPTKVIDSAVQTAAPSSAAVSEIAKPAQPCPSHTTTTSSPTSKAPLEPLPNPPVSPAYGLAAFSVVSTLKVETPLTPPASPVKTLSALPATPSSIKPNDSEALPPITQTSPDTLLATPSIPLPHLPYHPRGYLSPARIAKKLNTWYLASARSRPTFLDPPNLIELCPIPAYCKRLRATRLFAACDHSLLGMFEGALAAEKEGTLNEARRRKRIRGWKSLWDVDLWEEDFIGEVGIRKIKALAVIVSIVEKGWLMRREGKGGRDARVVM